MSYKAGVTFAREIRDWFDPDSPLHLLAFFQHQKTGRWPDGFLPSEVWFRHGWQEQLRRTIAACALPPALADYLDEYARLVGQAPDGVEIEPLGGCFAVRVGGRRWLLERGGSLDFVIGLALAVQAVTEAR